MTPVDVAVAHTRELVDPHAAPPARLLEIGCGDGHVAASLLASGLRVLALDTDPTAVERARAIGVDAVCASWPDFDPGRFDVVLFTRSLHHIHELDEAVMAAARVLESAPHPPSAPSPHTVGRRTSDVEPSPRVSGEKVPKADEGHGGVLLVEDFDFHAADRATIDWLRAVVREGVERGLVELRRGEFAADVYLAEDPERAWHASHDDHHLHPASSIRAAVAGSFAIESAVDAPYLYRYLLPLLPPTPEAAAWLAGVLERERTESAIRLIGRRIVARKPSTA